MSRYIDAELIKYQKNYKRGLGIDHDINEPGYYYTANKNDIDKVPTADVAPVVHAHWVYLGLGVYKCSDCLGDYNDDTAFCPNCGAKMDEEQEKCGG